MGHNHKSFSLSAKEEEEKKRTHSLSNPVPTPLMLSVCNEVAEGGRDTDRVPQSLAGGEQ